MTEIWKTIPLNLDHDYEVYNLGRVRKDEHILKQALTNGGYRRVELYVDGKQRQHRVHRLVMLAFVGPSDMFVLHWDNDRNNNALSNLRYGNHFDNAGDRKRHFNYPSTIEQVKAIRQLARDGWPTKYLVKLFKKSRVSIYKIINHITYEWVV